MNEFVVLKPTPLPSCNRFVFGDAFLLNQASTSDLRTSQPRLRTHSVVLESSKSRISDLNNSDA